MGELAVVGHLMVWGLLAVLAVLVLVLVRQTGRLNERIVPAGALMVNARLAVGQTAPEVTASDLHGEPVRIGGPQGADGQIRRAHLLLFIAPDCPISRALLPAVKSLARGETWLDVSLASDGRNRAAHQAFVAARQLEEFPYLFSEELGRAYGIGKIPYAVLIDERGRIASLGIVNSREHLESLFEAKERNVASIQEYFSAQQPAPAQREQYHDATD